MNGTIKFFNVNRHFGFIIGEDGDEVFYHGSSVVEGLALLAEGKKVSYEVSQDKGRTCAINVVVED